MLHTYCIIHILYNEDAGCSLHENEGRYILRMYAACDNDIMLLCTIGMLDVSQIVRSQGPGHPTHLHHSCNNLYN